MHSLTWGESNVMPGLTRSAKSISPPGMYTRLFFRTEVGNIVCGLYAGNLKLPVNAERAYVEEGEGPVTLGLA